jgi:hypothetical protein
MAGSARIIYDERTQSNYRKGNPGVTVRKFRSELKRQGLTWTETHYLHGEKWLGYLLWSDDRSIVEFKW